jgi:hypothetical protein
VLSYPCGDQFRGVANEVGFVRKMEYASGPPPGAGQATTLPTTSSPLSPPIPSFAAFQARPRLFGHGKFTFACPLCHGIVQPHYRSYGEPAGPDLGPVSARFSVMARSRFRARPRKAISSLSSRNAIKISTNIMLDATAMSNRFSDGCRYR